MDKPVWIDRGWYVAVEFELSTSGRMEDVLELARQNPHFVELVDERGVTVYRTIFFKPDFPRFDRLYSLIGTWKSTTLYVKGDKIPREQLDEWYLCYKVYWGHRKSLTAKDNCGVSKVNRFPDFLGCFERNIYLRWRDPLYAHYQHLSRTWYSFGERTRDRFVLDKPAMTAFLKKLNIDYEACPCYDHERIERVLRKLPQEINPAVHKEWLFKEDYLKSIGARSYVNYDIAISTLNAIVPSDEKSYHAFMERLLDSEG